MADGRRIKNRQIAMSQERFSTDRHFGMVTHVAQLNFSMPSHTLHLLRCLI